MHFAGLFLFCFTLPCSQPAERCSLVSVDGRRLRRTKQYSRHISRRQIDIRRLYHRGRRTELPRECCWLRGLRQGDDYVTAATGCLSSVLRGQYRHIP